MRPTVRMLPQKRRKACSNVGVADPDTSTTPVKCNKKVNTRSRNQSLCITNKATRQVTNPDTSIKPVQCYKNVNTRLRNQVIYVVPNKTTKQFANPDTSVKPVNCYKNMNTRLRNQVIVIPTIKRVKLENTGTKDNARVATQNSTSVESSVATNISQACDSGGQSSKTVNVQPKAPLLHTPQSVVKSPVPIPSRSPMILLNSPVLLNRETLVEGSMDVIKQFQKAGGEDIASDQESLTQKPGLKTSTDGDGMKSSTTRSMVSLLLNHSSTSVSKPHCIDPSPFKSHDSDKSCSSDISISKSCSSDMPVSMLRSTITSTSKSHSSDTSMSKSHTSNTTMSKSESEKQKSNLSVRNALTTTIDLEKYSSIQLVLNKCKENDRNDTTKIKTTGELNYPIGLKDGPITLPVRENDVVIKTNQQNLSSKDNFIILKKRFQHHCFCPPEQQIPVMTDQIIYEERFSFFKYFPNITMLLIHGQEITGLFDKGRWYVSVSEVKCKLLSNRGRYYLDNQLLHLKSGKKYLDADLRNYLMREKIHMKLQEEYMITVEYLKEFQTIVNRMQRKHSKCDYWSVGSVDDNFYIKTKGRMWCKACYGHIVKESSIDVYTDFQFASQEQESNAEKSSVGTMKATIVSGAPGTRRTAQRLGQPTIKGLVKLRYVDKTDPNINKFGYVMINKSQFTAFKVNNVCFVSIHELLMEHIVSVYSSNHHLKNLNYRPRTAPAAVRNHLQKTDKVLSNSGWIDTNILRCLCCLIWNGVLSLKKKLISSIIAGIIQEHFTYAFQPTHNVENDSFGMATKNFQIKDDGSIEEVSGPDPILTMARSRVGKKSVKRSRGSLSPRASGKRRKTVNETSGEGRKMAGKTSGKRRKVAGETNGKRRKMVTDASDQVSTENKSLKRSSSCLSPSTSGRGRQMVGELTDVNNGNHSIGQTEQLSEQSVCSQFEDSTKLVSLIIPEKQKPKLPIISQTENRPDATVSRHNFRKQDFDSQNLKLKQISTTATGNHFIMRSTTPQKSSHNLFENSKGTKNIESMECESELSASGHPTIHVGRPGQEVVPVGLFCVKSTSSSEETDNTVPGMMYTKPTDDNPKTSTRNVCGLQQVEGNNSVKDEPDCEDSNPQQNVCGLQQIEDEGNKDLDFEVCLAVKDEPDCEDSNPSPQNVGGLQQIEGEGNKDLDFEVRLAVKDELDCEDSNPSTQNVGGLQQIEGEGNKDLDFEVRLAVIDESNCEDSNPSTQNVGGLQQIEGEGNKDLDFEVRLAVKDESDCEDSNPSTQNVGGLQQIEGEGNKDLDFEVRLAVKDELDCEHSNPSPQNVLCPQQGEGEGPENWNS